MPNVLLKNVRCVFIGHKSGPKDIYLIKGIIQDEVPTSIPHNCTVIEGNCLIAFNDLIDLGTAISEPGHEYRETLEQTCLAAFNGGFSSLICFPNTFPAVDSKASVEYINSRSGKYHGVRLLPIGALTKKIAGEELAEILEMNEAGAVAFSDGYRPVQNGGILLRGFDYIKGIQKVLITTPYDETLFPKGQIHEGAVSTLLGMPGIPAPAEEIIVHRDIELARYTEGQLHLSCISTQGSLDLIRKAKAEGVNVSCSVSVNNLLFSVDDLIDYDPNLKLLPPLREKSLCKVLWEAVCDGTIDIITCQHRALEPEKKDLEFPYASFGALGLQTAVIALLTAFPDTKTAGVIQKAMSDNVIKIFNLKARTGEAGKVQLAVAEKIEPKPFTINELISNSYNSPFLGKSFNYQIKRIINH